LQGAQNVPPQSTSVSCDGVTVLSKQVDSVDQNNKQTKKKLLKYFIYTVMATVRVLLNDDNITRAGAEKQAHIEL